MSLSTYAGLKDAIESWSHRSDIASRIDDFIDLAESEMFRHLRIRDMETRTTASLSTRYLALPTGFLEMRRVRLVSGGQYYDLSYATPEALKIDSTTGMPTSYTVTSQLEFDRTPDSTYTIEYQYYQQSTALSVSNTSNAVLTRFPNIYLFGSLWALYMWALQEDKAEYYNTKMMQAVRTANREDAKGRHGPAPAMQYGGATP